MSRYIEHEGKRYRAWSKMDCGNKEIHEAHSWSSEFTVYGPYLCTGVPDPIGPSGEI